MSKKQEAVPAGRNARPLGRAKTRIVSISKIHHVDVMLHKVGPKNRMCVCQDFSMRLKIKYQKISHNIPAAALQVAHQKPLPSLEKFMLPKRMYIIQQPRKC